jgi:hypothetical protein
MNESIEYVIRVVLRARDELSVKLAKIREEIRELSNDADGLDAGLAGVNERITKLNQRSTTLIEKLGRLKKATDDLGGSVRAFNKLEEDLAKAERNSEDATHRQRDAMGRKVVVVQQLGDTTEGLTKTEKDNTQAQKDNSASTDKSTKATERKTAATRAAEKAARSEVDKLFLDAYRKEAEANTKRAQAFKELEQAAKSAKRALRESRDDQGTAQAAIARADDIKNFPPAKRAALERGLELASNNVKLAEEKSEAAIKERNAARRELEQLAQESVARRVREAGGVPAAEDPRVIETAKQLKIARREERKAKKELHEALVKADEVDLETAKPEELGRLKKEQERLERAVRQADTRVTTAFQANKIAQEEANKVQRDALVQHLLAMRASAETVEAEKKETAAIKDTTKAAERKGQVTTVRRAGGLTEQQKIDRRQALAEAQSAREQADSAPRFLAREVGEGTRRFQVYDEQIGQVVKRLGSLTRAEEEAAKANEEARHSADEAIASAQAQVDAIDQVVEAEKKETATVTKKVRARRTDEPAVQMLKTEDVAQFREFERTPERDKEKLDRLREEIEREGIKVPLELRVNKVGKAFFKEGNHRLAIAQELGIQEIPVVVVFRDEAGGRGKGLSIPGELPEGTKELEQIRPVDVGFDPVKAKTAELKKLQAALDEYEQSLQVVEETEKKEGDATEEVARKQRFLAREFGDSKQRFQVYDTEAEKVVKRLGSLARAEEEATKANQQHQELLDQVADSASGQAEKLARFEENERRQAEELGRRAGSQTKVKPKVEVEPEIAVDEKAMEASIDKALSKVQAEAHVDLDDDALLKGIEDEFAHVTEGEVFKVDYHVEPDISGHAAEQGFDDIAAFRKSADDLFDPIDELPTSEDDAQFHRKSRRRRPRRPRERERDLDAFPDEGAAREETLAFSKSFLSPKLIAILDDLPKALQTAARVITDENLSKFEALGVFQPRRGLVSVDSAAQQDDPAGLRSTLTHELFHARTAKALENLPTKELEEFANRVERMSKAVRKHLEPTLEQFGATTSEMGVAFLQQELEPYRRDDPKSRTRRGKADAMAHEGGARLSSLMFEDPRRFEKMVGPEDTAWFEQVALSGRVSGAALKKIGETVATRMDHIEKEIHKRFKKEESILGEIERLVAAREAATYRRRRSATSNVLTRPAV